MRLLLLALLCALSYAQTEASVNYVTCSWVDLDVIDIDSWPHVGYNCAEGKVIVGMDLNEVRDPTRVRCCNLVGHSVIMAETCRYQHDVTKNEKNHNHVQCGEDEVLVGLFHATTPDYVEDGRKAFDSLERGKCCKVSCQTDYCASGKFGIDETSCTIQQTTTGSNECDKNTVLKRVIDAKDDDETSFLQFTEIECCGLDNVSPPSISPTQMPTTSPTEQPTESPTSSPSFAPTSAPSEMPTRAPSESPTTSPSEMPSESPSECPTSSPTTGPSEAPSECPTSSPTTGPSEAPSECPTSSPTTGPTYSPTEAPTFQPTSAPSEIPTESPSSSPSLAPTQSPSNAPLIVSTIGPVAEEQEEDTSGSEESSDSPVCGSGSCPEFMLAQRLDDMTEFYERCRKATDSTPFSIRCALCCGNAMETIQAQEDDIEYLFDEIEQFDAYDLYGNESSDDQNIAGLSVSSDLISQHLTRPIVLIIIFCSFAFLFCVYSIYQRLKKSRENSEGAIQANNLSAPLITEDFSTAVVVDVNESDAVSSM